ncbi:MAG: DUF502 domain-containing protein [Pirellulaceae bacterium]|jgi:uncharacterized membrane protein|nr:DUF502 domain-containing protein [Pirellulaceae bacterium]
MMVAKKTSTDKPKRPRPFRKAVLRGLAVILPPLLTLAFFLWAWSLVQNYLLSPVESGLQYVLVESIWDVEEIPEDSKLVPGPNGIKQFPNANKEFYVVLPRNKEAIPRKVWKPISSNLDLENTTAEDCFNAYVQEVYLRPTYVIPIFLCVFIIVLYLLGKFLAAGAGRFMWGLINRTIMRLPVIRNVYSSVKQVTDFIFTDREVEYTQVVAVQYPRKGAWSIGFVTGAGMLSVREKVQEPMLSVLMPTSPMPATGFIITVPRSETIDLDITIDQAIQFVVSCGVVVPEHQQHSDSPKKIGQMIEQAVQAEDAPDQDATTEDNPDS